MYSKLEGMLRAEMFKVLDGEDEKQEKVPETVLVNELIREYLDFNGYSHTLSVFESGNHSLNIESGLPSQPKNRQDLTLELHVQDPPGPKM